MKIWSRPISPLIFATLLACMTLPAQAKLFSNSYVSFELPDGWECALEQTSWVCQHKTNAAKAKQAVIILTAKEVGPSDNLNAYKSYLNTPKATPSSSGQMITSVIRKNADEVVIDNQKWVDAIHQSSEIPNFITRYLATVKDQIAIAVTFSAHGKHYAEYSNDFMAAIRSLHVLNVKNLIGHEEMPGSSGTILAPEFNDPNEGGEAGGPPAGSQGINVEMILGIVIFAIAIGLYLVMKNKKKKTKRPF